MAGTVSGSIGELFSKLDQWSTWGKVIAVGGIMAFARLNWWLLTIAICVVFGSTS